MIVIAMDGLFGDEVIIWRGGAPDIPRWASSAMNNLYNIFHHRWQRLLATQAKQYNKAIDAADKAVEGLQVQILVMICLTDSIHIVSPACREGKMGIHGY